MRRGDELREHILFKAKDVFLETGFERASMDMIAVRADTTKRTVYAHFQDKERLFLSVVELVGELLRSKLGMPTDYGSDPIEALALYCARFRKILLWGPAIRTCRMGIAEAQRFPEGSTRIYEAIFATAQQRVEQFLCEHFNLTGQSSAQTAERLVAAVMHPTFSGALFGVEPIIEEWLDEETSGQAFAGSFRSEIARLVRTPE